MRYLLAIILPPIAVLSCGRVFSALLNLPLTLCFWVPGMIHALCVVADYNANKRHQQLVAAVRRR